MRKKFNVNGFILILIIAGLTFSALPVFGQEEQEEEPTERTEEEPTERTEEEPTERTEEEPTERTEEEPTERTEEEPTERTEEEPTPPVERKPPVIIKSKNIEEVVSISTSKKTYEEGDTIVISGKVNPIIGDTPVTLQILFDSNLIEIAQLSVGQDGSYSHTINAERPIWKNDGEHTIKALYGIGNTARITFDFVTEESISQTSSNFEVDAGSSGTIDVEYTIRGGSVNDIKLDGDNFGFAVKINSSNDGVITLNLLREAIDAKKPSGSDDNYIVLIDGAEVPYEEISQNSVERKIRINFVEGDSNIQIIGTWVIPEFGTIAMLVLAIIMISVIGISRNRLRIARQF